jgi:protein gp37
VSSSTSIEWTRGDDGSPGATWNPVTGCTQVSPGCDACYALTFAERWRGVPGHYFENGFDVQLRPDKLLLPLKWKKPRKIFVNSMSDLFHDDIPDEYIAKVFAVMAATPQHTYQLLSKRHSRMRSLLSSETFQIAAKAAYTDLWLSRFDTGGRLVIGAWPLNNVHVGVSVENQMWADIRIPALLQTPAAVRFISAEPLLGPITLFDQDHRRHQRDWDGGDWLCLDCSTEEKDVPWRVVNRADQPSIGWVIAGGESGGRARPAHTDWFRSLRDQCAAVDVPYLFKQHGAYRGFLTADEAHRPASLYVNVSTGEALPEAQVPDTGSWQAVWRLGKKAAGRTLDGVEHNGFPQAVTR